jgi:hypothetical protein
MIYREPYQCPHAETEWRACVYDPDCLCHGHTICVNCGEWIDRAPLLPLPPNPPHVSMLGSEAPSLLAALLLLLFTLGGVVLAFLTWL